MIFYLKVLKAAAHNSIRTELAYFVNNWSSVISPVVYTAAAILGTKIIFSNIKLLAGYTYGEMIFMLLVSQLAFYTHYTLIDSVNWLVDDVNSGNFDFVLTKPVPTFYFNLIRVVPIVSSLRDCLPPLILLIYFVPWATLPLTLPAILAGLLVLICGSICWYEISFLLALPVFWIGQSKEIYHLDYRLADAHDTPFEGFPTILRFLLSTIIPILIAGPLATSVALSKIAATPAICFSLATTIAFTWLAGVLWRLSLRNYSSASS